MFIFALQVQSLQVSVFIKVCKDQIDILKNRISDEVENGSSKLWLGLRKDDSQTDIVAHRHGVVCFVALFQMHIL